MPDDYGERKNTIKLQSKMTNPRRFDPHLIPWGKTSKGILGAKDKSVRIQYGEVLGRVEPLIMIES